MCGIFCIISKGSSPVNKEDGLIGLSTISHRGPDYSGHYYDKKCFLGLNRLAIFDLSADANQPFIFEDWVIVFNGAIFNFEELREKLRALGHQFKTTSDTEVLLKSYIQWGEEFENQLNGMWAFVIYNLRSQDYYLSRDRYGIKPLYISETSEYTLIASEIKAFYKLPFWKPEVNESRFFANANYSPHELVDNIDVLKPGYFTVISDKGVRIEKRYYHFDPTQKAEIKSKKEVEQQFLDLLKDSISIRTKGDVPFGLALSGGMDSGSIACLLNQKSTAISAVFNEKSANEVPFIKETLELSGHDSIFVNLNPQGLLSQLKDVTIAQEVPFNSFSLLAQNAVFKNAKLNGIKIMLSGQGADEILYGYDSFIKKHISILKKDNPFSAIQFLLKNIFYHPNLYLQYLSNKLGETNKGTPQYSFNTLKEYAWHTLMVDPLPSLLHYEDRNAMAHGIESRLPFLDHRLVEFCFSLDEECHFDGIHRKKLLAETMKGILPQSIINRKDKMAFNTPEKEWIKANYKILKSEYEKSKKKIGIIDSVPDFDKAAAKSIIHIITLGYWMEVYG